jgi:pimeloyl-ACP methyl ester carboxylesterase
MQNTSSATAAVTSTQSMRVPRNKFPSQLHLASKSYSRHHYTIFLCPGNPGVLAYYVPFLERVRALLDESVLTKRIGVKFDIYGRSMSGFDIDRTSRQTPYSLQEQIETTESAVIELTRTERLKQQKTKVILVGHSVGTYICLEMLRRGRLKQEGVDVKAGVMLCPTVMDLAGSPSGVKVRVREPLGFALACHTDHQYSCSREYRSSRR